MLRSIKNAYRTWLLDQSDENLSLLRKSVSDEKKAWGGSLSFPKAYEEAVQGTKEKIMDGFEDIIREEGRREGFDDGHEIGFEGGYEDGFNDGVESTL